MKLYPSVVAIMLFALAPGLCHAQNEPIVTINTNLNEYVQGFPDCIGESRVTRNGVPMGNGVTTNIVANFDFKFYNEYSPNPYLGLPLNFDLELIFAAMQEAEFEIEMELGSIGFDFIPGSVKVSSITGAYDVFSINSNQEAIVVQVFDFSYEKYGDSDTDPGD